MNPTLLRWLRPAAYVALVLAAYLGARVEQKTSDRHIVASQLSGCLRGGVMRAQVNYDTDLIRTFMLEAVKATAARPGKAAKIRAASYQRLADGLLDVPQPDCRKVIYRP